MPAEERRIRAQIGLELLGDAVYAAVRAINNRKERADPALIAEELAIGTRYSGGYPTTSPYSRQMVIFVLSRLEQQGRMCRDGNLNSSATDWRAI